MIHGGADTYIKPDMARTLYRLARQPKELWVVEGARHNQAFHDANEEYRQRVLNFFHFHLATDLARGNGVAAPVGAAAANGTLESPAPVGPEVAGGRA
jgi:hypothetical protein